MQGLGDVKRFWISRGSMASAYDFMAEVGEKGYEGLALFFGSVEGKEARVLRTYIPGQRAIRSASGLLLRVESEALHDLNVHLYETGLRLLAQIHSHAEHAYHSLTDDDYSIVTVLGGLSLVIPDFARRPFKLSECAAYRLTYSGWRELTDSEKTEQIILEE
jgi:hypothetical protein